MELDRLSVNKTVVLHGNLAILVTIQYRKDFNLSRWINEHLTEGDIKAWIEANKSR